MPSLARRIDRIPDSALNKLPIGSELRHLMVIGSVGHPAQHLVGVLDRRLSPPKNPNNRKWRLVLGGSELSKRINKSVGAPVYPSESALY